MSSSSTTATAAAAAAANIPDAAVKAQYVRDNNVHHLFELLASRVLDKRPANLFSFLRDELTKIEQVEAKAHSHDPSVVSFDNSHKHGIHGAPAGSSSSAAPASNANAANNAVAAAPSKPVSAGPLAISIAVFGIANAGKTALIAAMGGNPDPNTTPTIGFSPVQFNTEALNICIFDLGGGASFRGIWPHYYHDVHAVIYVVDASDHKTISESAKVFNDVVAHKYIHGKPLLVFANKQDVAGAMSCDDVVRELRVSELIGSAPWMAAGCVAVSPRADEVDKGVDWLLQTVQHRHTTLTQWISSHTSEVKAEKQRRLAEQRARVEAARAADTAAASK